MGRLNRDYICVQLNWSHSKNVWDWACNSFKLSRGAPEFAVIDSNGKIRLKSSGERQGDELLDFLCRADVDWGLADRLADDGDQSRLKKLLNALVNRKGCSSRYLIGKLETPPGSSPKSLTCVWPNRTRYARLSPSRLFFVKREASSGVININGYKQLRLPPDQAGGKVQSVILTAEPLKPEHLCRVSGCVVDDEGHPLARAVLFLDGGRSTISDTDGRFLFNSVPPGMHTVRADLKTDSCGYMGTLDILLEDGQNKEADIVMRQTWSRPTTRPGLPGYQPGSRTQYKMYPIEPTPRIPAPTLREHLRERT